MTAAHTSHAKSSPSSKKPAAASRPASAKPVDAIKLLETDHKEVKALFKQYEKLAKEDGPAKSKQAIALEICSKLKVHTTIEEELLYPAARAALKGDDADLVDEADVEHAGAKDLIAQIEASSPADDHYDAKVKVLGEQIDHHVGEEEEKMFPKLRKTALDLLTLGEELAARKDEVMKSMAAKPQHA